MNMVIPNEGKILLLDRALCTPGNAPEDYSCRLFQNNVTVADASTLADFTVATFTGYANVAVARSTFPTPSIVGAVARTISSVIPTFTCTGGASQTVYGWILVGVTSGKVIAGQNFAVPRVMSPGATEKLDPFQMDSQTLH